MKDKTGRPISVPFSTNPVTSDLEQRKPYLPDRLITPRTLAALTLAGTGTEVGRYGLSLYGRCIYGYRKGIYGADTYGDCSYW